MLQAVLTFIVLARWSTDQSTLEEKTPLEASSAERPGECGSPALFSWGDVDGDARLDLAAVSAEGVLQLLANNGEGRFEDVTERLGLSGITNAALALWIDYDADGRLDLFVGARSGASRLFHNESGLFVDMTTASGLASEGAVQSAHWLDHDGDGRLDLHVVTAQENELCSMIFRGLEGGFFERSELPALAGAGVDSILGGPMVVGGRPASIPSGAPRNDGVRGGASIDGSLVMPGSSRAPIVVGPGSGPSGTSSSGLIPTCLLAISDQSNPGACLRASSTPTLGRLYPISANLFVAVGGNVGIGTTTPSARLEVAGTARVTDTLTLAPAGDTALNVSTGSIYKGGTPFIHTKGGGFNTALGQQALASVTTGSRNTASGYSALRDNTTGYQNTASGVDALQLNSTGFRNTAGGSSALRDNTTGNENTASGVDALRRNTTGSRNTASGYSALHFNTTGLGNTASGAHALFFNTTGSSNTASGRNALLLNTTGNSNTASGYAALRSNTTGGANTASGAYALRFNTTGFRNTASGAYALYNNTTGYRNTASGSRALHSNTTGARNTACGYGALSSSTATGNIALGFGAGQFLTTGNDNITIGHYGVAGEQTTIRIGSPGSHFRAFIAGIRGATTGVANAIPVLVDGNGQLGTISSSARFKEEIRDMGELTERLLQLRPVVFRYKPEVQAGERPLEYGLIAEEVAEAFPELVVYDDEGKPFTVKYHLLSSMLLNEFKRLKAAQDGEVQTLNERLEAQSVARERELEAHERELDELRSRLAELESRTSQLLSAATPADGR